MNVRDVLTIIEIALGGKAAAQVYEGNRAFDLTIRFPEKQRDSVEKIAKTLVGTSDGIGIPLSQLADISLQQGPVQISRDNGMRLGRGGRAVHFDAGRLDCPPHSHDDGTGQGQVV